jgi:TRAP-type C4-dicarboxylate transport system substrate-binding protein
MKKRLLAFVLFAAMVLGLSACGKSNNNTSESTPPSSAGGSESGTTASAQVDPLNVTFNISVSGELYDEMSQVFAQQCSELSGGAITVQIVAPGTMGSAREVVEACQLNSVNMIWAADSELDQVVGNLSWAWLPYTVINYEQADEYYNEGWIDEAIGEICSQAGIECVAGAENGFRLVCVKGAEIASLADMAGIKIRVPEQAPLMRFYTLCGALPSTITANESFSAMQQGTVDGSDNTLFNLYNLGFFDIIDSITLLNYQYSSGKICANGAWWNGLSDAQREIITQAAAQAGQVQREGVRNQEAELVEIAESMGLAVIEPDEAFQAELKEVAAVMWEESYDDYDAAYHPYVDKMIETFGG